MTLIKVPNKYYEDDFSRLIKFYRENPIIAAEHLLKRDGEPLILAPIQQVILMEWFNSKFSLLTASRGAGKAAVNGTKVLTTEGWIKIEDLKVGDKVITPKGIEGEVTGVYPQGYLPTYKITFRDGRAAYCSHDHLWTVKYCEKDGWETVPAKVLKETIKDKEIGIPRVYNLNNKFKKSKNGFSLDTDIITTAGWKKLRDIQIGDTVFNQNGTPSKILNLVEYKNIQCYKLNFDNAPSIVCGKNQRWTVKVTQNKRYKLEDEDKSTEELFKNVITKYNKVNYKIKRNYRLEFKHKNLPIDPYVFGYWLADGNSNGGRLACPDVEIIDEIKRLGYTVTQCKDVLHWYVKDIIKMLHKLNVYKNKHIPDEYLFSSKEQRLKLLRGLMDGDGHCEPISGVANFSNTNIKLAEGVEWLIRSLGGKTTMRGHQPKKIDRNNSYAYAVKFCPNFQCFFLPRKANRLKPFLRKEHRLKIKSNKYYINSIEKCNDRQDIRLIGLEGESNILIGKGLVPSDASEYFRFKKIVKTEKALIRNKKSVFEAGGSCEVSIPMYEESGKPRNEYTIDCKIPTNKNKVLYIQSIEESIQQECTCIKIDSSEGLFIIDDYIVTHNTFISAVYAALKGLLYPGTRTGIFAPAFRQSKLIFKEFTTLYEDSPILQECVDKAPVQLNDQCVCVFKPAARESQGSFVKAFPIGSSGDKIRGQRISQVLMDEVPHIPESIFRSVVQPMMSTAKNPMQRVKQIEQLSEFYDGNIPEDLLSTDNGYIGITSGYYQFNYWWKTMQDFYKSIKTGSTKYNLRFVPYTELPPGFFEKDIVEDARMNAPSHMFLTEWMAEWIADSEGAFPMSLLESARDINLEPKYARDPNKDKGREFIFGIDVARERDSTAISIIEVGYPSKLVCLFELENRAFPEQAKLILQLVEKFNPNLIYMDEFGGGQTLRDHLADPASVGWPATSKIVSVEDSLGFSGKRILKLCNFNPAFIEDANNNTKTLLEQGMIKLPAANHPIEGYRKGNMRGMNKEVDLVQELINQVASIVVTPTTTGRLHYDLPKTAANSLIPNVRKKDLYTSFILACKCIYDTQWKPKADRLIVEKGVIKEIKSKDTNLLITGSDSVILDGRIINGINSTIYPQKTIIQGGGIIITGHGRKKR